VTASDYDGASEYYSEIAIEGYFRVFSIMFKDSILITLLICLARRNQSWKEGLFDKHLLCFSKGNGKVQQVSVHNSVDGNGLE
jgi:hypothetical protein